MSDRPIYRLGDEIGRGALGRVVRVHVANGTDRAGKILHPSHRADAKALARFADEAELLARLRHPNVVAVHGLRDIDGERVLLMELVDGMSLASAIAIDAPFPETRIAAIGRGIAAGLAAAHHAGLIHRDLKPDNVLLTATDSPKLVDFGLARATSFAGVDPSAFAIVGTPDYMAPETIDPLAVDPRTDLYSLGCMLYEMATGKPPYAGATAFAVLEAHRSAAIPTVLDNAYSRQLCDLIAALLAKSPADRPQSATAVQDALDQLAGEPPNEQADKQAANTAADHSPRGRIDEKTDTQALVATANPVADHLTVHGGQCVACGDPAVRGVPVCFGCGLEQVRLEPGDRTVFVTGPGQTTHKLDLALRDRLLTWLAANPGFALDVEALRKQLPRLPFVLAVGVSERSAEQLVASLSQLGLEAQAVAGGRFALRALRKKSLQLGGRIALIGMGGLFGLQYLFGAMTIPALGIALLAAQAAGWHIAAKPVTKPANQTVTALPAAVATALERIVGAVPGIRERRHRESLRAVVQRVLATRECVPPEHSDAVDVDFGRVLDLALVAAARIDELETALAQNDLRNPTAEARAQMLERDSWAARLLEITAFLDVLRASYVALTAPNAPDDSPAPAGNWAREHQKQLDDLRAHIEALEEVQGEVQGEVPGTAPREVHADLQEEVEAS